MLVLVDNSQQREDARFTPKLIKLIKYMVSCDVLIVKTLQDAREAVIFHADHVRGIIFGGGPLLLSGAVKMNDYSKNVLLTVEFPHIPQLHICFGAQVLASVFGGVVEAMQSGGNRGWKQCTVTNMRSRLLRGLPREFSCCTAHHDVIADAPVNFHVVARGPNGEIQAIERDDEENSCYLAGVQFHPEASKKTGHTILRNFLDKCQL